jgi:O-acetylhomoserine (thiol)-lyase
MPPYAQPVAPRRGFATEQVHGGAELDPAFGARIPPIHLTAGFVFDDFAHARARFAGDDEGYTYSRHGNPTHASLERRLARLESGTDALLVGSGQAAITVALLSLLQAGDHVVASAHLYEGSRGLLLENFARFGIDADFVDEPTDPAAWRALMRPTTRVLFGESIANPVNEVLDVTAVAEVAHERGVPLVVDNTLATPYLLRPLEHGADVVVHSASKLLSGHGASLGGVVVSGDGFDWAARRGLFPQLTAPARALHGRSYTDAHGRGAFAAYARDLAARLGPTISPVNAFLVQQGVETLSLRVGRQSDTALALARWLEERPEVVSVDHAGLTSSRSAALARRYLPDGAGCVFAFTLGGGEPAAQAFVDAVQLVSRMTHVGDVRTLVLHPASTTHAHRTPQEQRAARVGPGLLRLSVGVEDPADLLDDLERGLRAVRALSSRPTAATAPTIPTTSTSPTTPTAPAAVPAA